MPTGVLCPFFDAKGPELNAKGPELAAGSLAGASPSMGPHLLFCRCAASRTPIVHIHLARPCFTRPPFTPIAGTVVVCFGCFIVFIVALVTGRGHITRTAAVLFVSLYVVYVSYEVLASCEAANPRHPAVTSDAPLPRSRGRCSRHTRWATSARSPFASSACACERLPDTHAHTRELCMPLRHWPSTLRILCSTVLVKYMDTSLQKKHVFATRAARSGFSLPEGDFHLAFCFLGSRAFAYQKRKAVSRLCPYRHRPTLVVAPRCSACLERHHPVLGAGIIPAHLVAAPPTLRSPTTISPG
jgi:Ca2+/Na+ antiporter